jgi:hypothetical protein
VSIVCADYDPSYKLYNDYYATSAIHPNDKNTPAKITSSDGD